VLEARKIYKSKHHNRDRNTSVKKTGGTKRRVRKGPRKKFNKNTIYETKGTTHCLNRASHVHPVDGRLKAEKGKQFSGPGR